MLTRFFLQRSVLCRSGPALGCALISILGSAKAAEPVALLRAENGMISGGYCPSSPLVSLGDCFLFTDDDPVHGLEVWASDGTEGGTMLLKDIFPGTRGSDPGWFIEFEDRIFFTAWDHDHGPGIWSSDGTPEGTVLLLSFGQGTRDISWITEVEDRLFFTTTSPDWTHSLWLSDGTPEGSRSIGDFSNEYFPQHLGTLGGRLFFALGDPEHGDELWISDGTPEGTRLFKDLVPGGGSSHPWGFSPALDKLFFSAVREPGGEYGLWVTDGTPEGTSFLVDGPVGGGAPLGDRFFFNYQSELWVSDGTAGGTKPFLDFGPGSGTYDLTTAGNRIFFKVWIQSEPSGIWVTDGTIEGTRRFLAEPSDARGFFRFGDRLFFDADCGLWSSDGTPEGTRIFKTAPPEPGGAIVILEMAPLGNRLLFSASDPDHGPELWTSDGTPEGTVLLKEIWPGQGGSYPSSFTSLGDRLFFSASDPDHGNELWASDGTAEGTVLVADLAPGSEGSSPGLLAAAGQRLFFLAFSHPNLPQNLWVLDGTEAGTSFLREFPPFTLDRFEPFGPFGGGIFFLVGNGTNELWTSDGTPEGTALFRSGATELHGTGEGIIFFTAWDGQGLRDLWFSDGTSEGTRLLRENLSNESWFLLGRFLSAYDPDHGTELLALNVTGEGETLFDLIPGPGSSFPRFLTPAGERIFFVAYGAEDACIPLRPIIGHGCIRQDKDLWTSDGTSEGTKLIGKDIVPAQRWDWDMPLPWGRAAARGRLYFAGLDSEHGDELWVSDGTPSGTRMLADLVPGTGGSWPETFVHAGDRLFFTAAGKLWTLPLNDEPPLFRRGDSNADGTTDISDAIAVLADLFLGSQKVPCAKTADANDDGAVDISDAIYLLSFLFLGGPALDEPRSCGPDPTADDLTCESYDPCP